MDITETYYAKNRNQWRQWLEKNHLKKKEIWLRRYKKKCNEDCISYEDSVEEALCFGWIDSTVKKIDEEHTYQKFTPRKNTKLWCNNNRVRVRKLIKEGKMTNAGLEKIDPSININEDEPLMTQNIDKEIPKWIEKIFKSDKEAWDFYSTLSRSQKRLYLLWILNAKKEATKQRRAETALTRLKDKKKL